MLPEQYFIGFAQQIKKRGRQGRQQHNAEHNKGPPPGRRQGNPAHQQQNDQCTRYQTAPQIIEQLPLRQRRERIDLSRGALPCNTGWHLAAQPAAQLPVTAYPALPAADIGAVAGGIILVQLHIAEQTSPCVTTFDQIMTEDAIFREAPTQRLLKSINVVNTLADE